MSLGKSYCRIEGRHTSTAANNGALHDSFGVRSRYSFRK